MKRIIAAFILASITFTACIIGIKSTEKCTDQIYKSAKQCIYSYQGEKDNISDDIENLTKTIRKCEPLLFTFSNHQIVDEIEASAKKMKYYLLADDLDSVFDEYYNLIIALDRIKNEQKIELSSFS